MSEQEVQEVMAVQGAPPAGDMAENWVMLCSEMHRYQGVSYKSDIIVISGEKPQLALYI